MVGILQRSFLGGEISEDLLSRDDQAKQRYGVARMLNWIPNRSGAADNRPGTKYIAGILPGSRLIRWAFSRDQSYQVIFGDFTAQLVLDDQIITGQHVGIDPWATLTMYAPSDIVLQSGVAYYCVAMHLSLSGSNDPSTAAGLKYFWHPLPSAGAGASVFEIPTPYALAEVSALKHEQSGDIMWLTHPSHPAHELVRKSALSWTLMPARFAPGFDPPQNIVLTPPSPSSGNKDIRYKVSAREAGTNYESLPGGVGAPTNAVYDYAQTGDGDMVFTVAGGGTHGMADGDEIATTYIAPSLTYANENLRILMDSRAWTIEVVDTFSFSLKDSAGLLTGPVLSPADEPVLAIEYRPAYATATNEAIPIGSGTKISLSWDPVENADEYLIYRSVTQAGSATRGEFGLVGTTRTTSYDDAGREDEPAANNQPKEVDYEVTPIFSRNPFFGLKWPSGVSLHDQRLVFLAPTEFPTRVNMSKAADLRNFSRRSPGLEDDALQFDVSLRGVNQLYSIESLGSMLLFSDGCVVSARGRDGSGFITGVDGPELEAQGYVGAGDVRAVVADATVLYTEDSQSIVREVGFDLGTGSFSGYVGKDMTIWCPHLFQWKKIVRMEYARVPTPIVWALLDDGTLLSMTYLPEHDVNGWAVHQTAEGDIIRDISLDVCADTGHDCLMMVIERQVQAERYTYLERMLPREVDRPGGDNRLDSVFHDCSVMYDGRNTDGSTVLQIIGSGSETWLAGDGETYTIESLVGSPGFGAGWLGQGIRVVSATTGEEAEVIITALDGPSTTRLFCQLLTDVPPSLQATDSTTEWVRMINVVGGLVHLLGREVSVLADGYDLGLFTVDGSGNLGSLPVPPGQQGEGVLPGAVPGFRPYGYISAGLPYNSDLELLDPSVDTPDTWGDKHKRVAGVNVWVRATRGLLVGPDENSLFPEHRMPYESKTALYTGKQQRTIGGNWERSGRTLIRQSAPLPATVRAVVVQIDIEGDR